MKDFTVPIGLAVMIIAIFAIAWSLPVLMRFAKNLPRAERPEQPTYVDTTPAPPLCCVPGCKAPAELRPLRVVRAEGILSWLRSRIGAPVRWRVEWDPWKSPKWCRGHGELAHAECRAFLIEFELSRVKAQRDAEVALSRFESVGLDERVESLVKAHDDRMTK